jgi:hypothetical protein
MAVQKPRNRTLIFRLTQEEYEALQAASSGARSLSEFARAKLMHSLGPSPLDANIDAKLYELTNKVSRIEQLLEKN